MSAERAPLPDSGWAEHAHELAEFALANLFVRTDAFGEFLPGKEGVTVKAPISLEVLEAHFRGERFIGAHTTSRDNLCLFGVLDFDEDDNPRNREIALGMAQILRDRGFRPLLEESRQDRFHLWVRFAEPVPTSRLFALLQELAGYCVDLGLKPIETFPKQALLDGPDRFGNWLRVPGRHPSETFTSRIFDPETDGWLGGAAAADAFLAWPASNPHALPKTQEPPSSAPEPQPRLALVESSNLILEGARNNTLARFGGSMRAKGASADMIAAALLVMNRECCRPPLPDAEVRKIAASIGRYLPGSLVPVSDHGHDPQSSNGATPRNRFRDAAISDIDLFAADIKKPVSILGDDLFPVTEYAFLYGRTGHWKTWIADQLAFDMSRGRHWYGLRTTQGRVGIVTLEMTAYYHRERLRKLSGGQAEGNILTITVDRLDTAVDLLDPEQQRELVDWAKGEGFQLVIVDPLSLAFSGSETNEEHVVPLLAFARQFPVRTNCGLLLVHHEPKPAQGTSITDDLAALRGRANLGDHAAFLARIRGNKDGSRELAFIKTRHASPPDSIWLRMSDDGVPAVAEAPEDQSEAKRRRMDLVLDIVNQNDWIRADNIREKLEQGGEKVTIETVRRYLKALEKASKVACKTEHEGSGVLWKTRSEGA